MNHSAIICIIDDAKRAADLSMCLMQQEVMCEVLSNEVLESSMETLEGYNAIIVDDSISEPTFLVRVMQLKHMMPNKPIMLLVDGKDMLAVGQAMHMGVREYLIRDENQAYLRILPLMIEMMVGKTKDTAQDIALKAYAKQLEVKNAELEQMAHYDNLTGLESRSLFATSLKKALERAKREQSILSVFYIDIDNFKQINDTYGHIVGDQVLQKISERLKREVRGQDHVARLGGDELAAVMEGFRNDQDVTLIAHHISKVLSEPIIFDSFIVEVSCSIGGASYPTNGDTVEMLLERADKAMYESKQKHKGSFHFYSQAMNEAARHFLELEKDLHFALKRNEFQLFYQPLVASENEAVMAVECFLRWHHPERGMVLPSEFLPSAERSNVIELIGKWVIEQALKEYKAWQNLGIAPQTLAINLSARQLNNDYFVDMVNALLKTHNVPPHVLSFEVQEAHIIERKGKIGSTIQGLQWLGVGIHVDHFSGEHISCVQMITLSVDRLKLGHRITSNVGANKRYQSAMSGLIDFAKQLKLALVAEGVESQEQYDFLKGKGCELLQGYFIKRPTEAKKFRAWLVQSQQARIAKENSLPVS